MQTLKSIEWRVVWLALKRMCFAAGAITLVSWFANLRFGLEAVCSFAFVLLVWVMLYKFILTWRAQFSQNLVAKDVRRKAAKRVHPAPAAAGKPGVMREFFAGLFEGASDEFRTLRAARKGA
jgi:hypothetical protein